MGITANPQRLFTERCAAYERFIRLMLYPQGLQTFFLGSPLLRPGLRILDAGCGTGVVTLALRDALVRRGFAPQSFHAFDLTPAMLNRFQATLQRRAIDDVELAQANVLDLAALPPSWNEYDLVVSAGMLEYVPRARFVDALKELRARLKKHGSLLLFITRRNPLMRIVIGRWWQSNLYSAAALADALEAARFSRFAFRSFPASSRHLFLWGHIVEAQQ